MNSIFPNDKWTLAEGEIDGDPLVIRLRSSMPSQGDREIFSRLVIVTWDYSPNPSGMPESDVHSQMSTLEDALEAGTEQRGVAYQAVSLTGSGEKQWRYYASDIRRFLESLNEDLIGHDPYPIKIEEFEDPEWNGLAEFLDEIKT